VELFLDPRIIGALGLITLLTIAPGPDMALVTTTALTRGRAAAIRTSLGISTGTLIWAALSGLGVATILAASAEAFTVVRLAGATYLVYLGVRALADAWRGDPHDLGMSAADIDIRRSAYRRGLVTNLLNPKVGLFYTTLVPQLVGPGDPVALASICVGLAHAAIGTTWLCLLAALVDRAAGVLQRPRIRRTIAGMTGAILIAFGLRVAAEPR
jgi:threonine/homoserine/homoserine lactone efflux protein